MSDFVNDWMEEHQGQTNALGHLAAINQRNQSIAQQRELVAAFRSQAVALESQNRIDQDRAEIERQRLEIEQQRFAADEADRELRRQQTEQLKQLRNLMADTSSRLAQFRKRYLA